LRDFRQSPCAWEQYSPSSDCDLDDLFEEKLSDLVEIRAEAFVDEIDEPRERHRLFAERWPAI